MDVVQVMVGDSGTLVGHGILAQEKIHKVVKGGVFCIQNVVTDFTQLDVAYVARIVLLIHLIRVLCVVEIFYHIQLEIQYNVTITNT